MSRHMSTQQEVAIARRAANMAVVDDWACVRKRSYTTRDDAQAAVDRLVNNPQRRMSAMDAARLEPYRCRSCGHWHIGKNRKTGFVAKRPG